MNWYASATRELHNVIDFCLTLSKEVLIDHRPRLRANVFLLIGMR
jgi:hypothetical protein